MEEKLLIGDRPKPSAEIDKKLSLRERLVEQSPKRDESVSYFIVSIDPLIEKL